MYVARGGDVWIGYKYADGQWNTTDGSDDTFLKSVWENNPGDDPDPCVVAKNGKIKTHVCDGHGHFVVCQGKYMFSL